MYLCVLNTQVKKWKLKTNKVEGKAYRGFGEDVEEEYLVTLDGM